MNRRTFLLSVPFVLPIYSRLWQGEKIAARTEDENLEICQAKFDFAIKRNLYTKPIGEIVAELAASFIGVDYEANSLEQADDERLIINLRTLDCVLLYENALALARCIKCKATTYDAFKKELQLLRYRGGVINCYISRLHYTTDYFYDNEKKGTLRDITKSLGGIPYRKQINFMSSHPEKYFQLQNNSENLNAMKRIEGDLNKRTKYYLPKSQIKKVAYKIMNGDILGITTNINGLDCSHTGVAYYQNGVPHLLHAPKLGLKVQITQTPLWKYLEQNKMQTGIIVARPIEPTC